MSEQREATAIELGRADASSSFLEVRDLKVHFPTDDGLVKSVDGHRRRVRLG